MKRIVVSGYYGYGNTGDEAVLAGILATFRQLDAGVEVTVLSGDPARTHAEHPGVEVAHRYRISDLLRVIRGADLVISGGGSLLQDATSARSIYYYLFVLRLARMLGRKTMVYAQGIGPLARPGARRCTASTLNRTNAITVRDADSKALLESIGVRVPVSVVADPSFVVEPDLEAADKVLEEHGLRGEEFIAVSLRNWAGQTEWLPAVAEGLRTPIVQRCVRIALVPMQEPEDIQPLTDLGTGVLLRGAGGVRAMKGIIARSGLVVGMRLHSLIFAASEGVPFVPIVYDPKVASFAQAVGQPCSIDVATLTADAITEAVRNAWDMRLGLRESLAERISHLKELALEPGRIALDLLGAERV